jgi:hypothetical protein
MSETISPAFWAGFFIFIGAMLALDLFVFHRKPGEVTMRSAALTSAFFAVTSDPFIVYTSNAFAILGLRSLYIFLADLKDGFRYLTHGLSIVLVFVGLKLLANPWIHLPPWVSLVVVAAVLGGAIAFSLAHARREERAALRSQP